MPRRIEIELTSSRDDGSWTWRAAGARQPKGVLDGGVLPGGAKVGDVLRAEVEIDVDGINVTSVAPPREARPDPERLTLIARREPEELVSTSLVPGRERGPARRRGGPRDRGERPDRPDRPREGRGGGREGGGRPRRPERRPGSAGGTEERAGGRRRERGRPASTGTGSGERSRASRPPREAPDARPSPKRLRPGRTHRKAVLDELAPEERPVAEEVLRGGIPSVRQALDKQNEQAKAEGRPVVPAESLVAMAERLLPRLRAAEWRDRADAALADIDELDLRDLRSVVVAADTAAKDDETRTQAAALRDGLARRVEQEQSNWLQELSATLSEGRIVRALRLSSRPPKAGARFPADLSERLAQAASAALTSDVSPDRWATVLDAVSLSPVRLAVTPQSRPDPPGEALLTTVRNLSARVPQVAAAFGIEPSDEPPPRRRRPRRPGAEGSKGPTAPSGRRRAKAEPGSSGPTPPSPRSAPIPPPPAPSDPTSEGAASAAPPSQPAVAEATPTTSEAPAAPVAAEPPSSARTPSTAPPPAPADAPPPGSSAEPVAPSAMVTPTAEPETEQAESAPDSPPADHRSPGPTPGVETGAGSASPDASRDPVGPAASTPTEREAPPSPPEPAVEAVDHAPRSPEPAVDTEPAETTAPGHEPPPPGPSTPD